MTAGELAIAARALMRGGAPQRPGARAAGARTPRPDGRKTTAPAPDPGARTTTAPVPDPGARAAGTSTPGSGARELAGVWPRAVALLGRQALEQGLDDLWGAVAPRVREASRHAQLLCLGAFVRDEELVSGVRHAWHGLSQACHHQVYELAPTAAELDRWLDAVERLLAHDPIAR